MALCQSRPLANNFWSNSQSMTELFGRCPCSQEKGRSSFWVLKCSPMHALACLLVQKGIWRWNLAHQTFYKLLKKFGRRIFNWNWSSMRACKLKVCCSSNEASSPRRPAIHMLSYQYVLQYGQQMLYRKKNAIPCSWQWHLAQQGGQDSTDNPWISDRDS